MEVLQVASSLTLHCTEALHSSASFTLLATLVIVDLLGLVCSDYTMSD